MASDMAVLYEHAVIQDLQLSLQRACEDKQELRATAAVLMSKLSNAEKVIKSANRYLQALEDEVEDPNGHLIDMIRAVAEWNTNTKRNCDR
jgi:hypothetical protein